MPKKRLVFTSMVLLLALLTAACGTTQTLPDASGTGPVPTAVVTIETLDTSEPATETGGTETVPTEASATEVPSPTSPPVIDSAQIGILFEATPPGMPPAVIQQIQAVLDQNPNAEVILVGPQSELDTALANGANLIIVVGAALADFTQSAADNHPDIHFIGIDQSVNGDLPNLLLLGGAASRQDELGFIAGMLVGFASNNKIVGSIAPADGGITTRKYTNGFLHGLRLSCGECEYWPIELENYDDPAQGADTIRRLQGVNVDSVFAAPGIAGTATLQTGASQGVYVVGVGDDYNLTLPEAGDYLLPSPIWQVSDTLDTLVNDFIATGGLPAGPIPLSFADGTLGLALNSSPGVSQGELRFIQDVIEDLRSGVLFTGIDPLTGEEL